MSVEEFVEAPAERLVAMTNANDVERSYAYCREVARREAKNFYYSFVALPKAKRDAICAVYAFMRKADDLSDDESKSHAQRRQELAEWMASWQRTDRVEFSGGTGDDPIFPALLDAKRRFHISSQLLEQLVAGTAMDLDRPVASAGIFDTYATFGDLYQYCYLVASVVGLVCIRIFGYEDIRAEKLAEETGIAFQLTNILRDVREDAERNRIYLPLDQLARYDVTPGEIVGLTRGEPMQARHKAVLAETAQHAEEFYQSASQLLKLIEPDSRPALWVLVTIYHRLLLRMESAITMYFRSASACRHMRRSRCCCRGLRVFTGLARFLGCSDLSGDRALECWRAHCSKFLGCDRCRGRSRRPGCGVRAFWCRLCGDHA